MKKCGTAGFSLIELMIVVGLIAVIGGMTVPAVVAGMRQYSLISATQQVASTIRAARYQAVGRNAALQVRFQSPAPGQYQVLQVVGGVDVPVGPVQYLPDGADFGDVSGNIQIDSQGRVTALAGPLPATIVVTNGGQDRMITVSQRGRVELP